MSTIVTITPATTSVLAFTPATPVMRPTVAPGVSMVGTSHATAMMRPTPTPATPAMIATARAAAAIAPA